MAAQSTAPVPTGIWDRATADPLMALLTFGLLLFAGWQVAISRDTARRQLRAYIAVKGVDVQQRRDRIVAKISLKNVGQTPARNVRAGCKILLVPKGQTSELVDYEFPEDPQTGLVWGAGLELPPLSKTLDLNEQEAAAVSDTKTVIAFIVGCAKYQDIFGKRHFTNFRYMLDPVTDTVTSHRAGGNNAS
ncbi:MAG: hypothetical protein ABL889_21530 [Terricaulis sp.]